jgi:hypothetical protein
MRPPQAFEIATDVELPPDGDFWQDLREDRVPPLAAEYGLSQALEALVVQMLAAEPRTRPSAGEILQHQAIMAGRQPGRRDEFIVKRPFKGGNIRKLSFMDGLDHLTDLDAGGGGRELSPSSGTRSLHTPTELMVPISYSMEAEAVSDTRDFFWRK